MAAKTRFWNTLAVIAASVALLTAAAIPAANAAASCTGNGFAGSCTGSTTGGGSSGGGGGGGYTGGTANCSSTSVYTGGNWWCYNQAAGCYVPAGRLPANGIKIGYADPSRQTGVCRVQYDPVNQEYVLAPPAAVDVMNDSSQTTKIPVQPPGINANISSKHYGEKKMLWQQAPAWLWTGLPSTFDSQFQLEGIDFTTSQHLVGVMFDMGDGSAPFTCGGPGTPWVWTGQMMDLVPSPDCGYTYQKPGTYTITATAIWDMYWTASTGENDGGNPVRLLSKATAPMQVGEIKVSLIPNDWFGRPHI